ncbi:hypothetical protein RHGRI_029562 [Rhododendron griersonianum]|uniref:Aminotransferase-like plant mobile domain-containing protein n=1 Tax=Rhododendron griersonianum TaxID=479676 RepID=A0AAV6IN55_9ERIC|nr:hypothetical protein RHGRI_029562 [Rhododendron griersonianum]
MVEAREEVGEVGGRGAGGRVIRNRKRQEEVMTEAREEVGEVGGRGAGGRVLRNRKRWRTRKESAKKEVGGGCDRGPEGSWRSWRWRTRRESAKKEKEAGVDREDEGEDDDLQSEAAVDDDIQSEVEAEDDELQEDEEESDLGDDEAEDGPPIGPQDRSLLKDFRNHVATAIWGGTERKLLKTYNHSRLLRKWELPKTNRRFMEKVTASGLLPLAGITYKYSNNVLLSAFVERWHPQMNSFHFRFGEMTITLDNVPYLIGVPVEGLAVHAEVHGKEDCVALPRRWLGVTKANAKAAIFCGGVTFEWLWNNFHESKDDATDDRHFPMFRHAMNPNYTEDLPRAARWHSRREAKSATTVRYREMLDDVQATQCRAVVADIVFYTGCICCMTVEEPYLPDRVLRQFGLVQFVPGPPLALLRGSRGSTAATYSVVYQYTEALWTVSHVRVAPNRGEGQFIEIVEERNAATLALLDTFLGGRTVSRAPVDMRNTILEVRRILRGAEVGDPTTLGPT